jgi:hypothetical protein
VPEAGGGDRPQSTMSVCLSLGDAPGLQVRVDLLRQPVQLFLFTDLGGKQRMDASALQQLQLSPSTKNPQHMAQRRQLALRPVLNQK